MHRFAAIGTVLAVLAIGAEAPARQETGKKLNELQKAQLVLEGTAIQAAQTIATTVKEETVALVDLRPAIDNAAAAANAPILQNYVMQAFLKEGLLVFAYEQEHKLDVKYSKDGKLARTLPLAGSDVKTLMDRKVRYALVPQLAAKDSGSAVTIDLYSLENLQIVGGAVIGPIPTKRFPLAALCSAEILPPLNVKVLSFAAANFGRQVDRGECWDLPAVPLRDAKGKVDGYVFGREVPWEQGKAGDVITFGTDGATGGHVVVLYKWTAKKADATILHQNVNNVRKVMFGNLGRVESGKAGQKFALWRPQL
jgi:hypothetical protein